MSEADALDLMAVICAGGAIGIGFLVARMPSLDGSARARRTRDALLGCSIVILLGSVALLMTTASTGSLREQLSALDGAHIRALQGLKADSAREGEAARARESRARADLDRLTKQLLRVSKQLDDIERQRLGELGVAIAKTQQVVVEQTGAARLETLVFGEYVVAFETSVLTPAGDGGNGDGSWWVQVSEHARGARKLEHQGAEPLAVCMKGVRSVPGHFGHLGGYTYLFLVTDVLAVGPDAESTCRQWNA